MKEYINIADISGTASIIKDYLREKDTLSPYYGRSLSPENLIKQSKEKLSQYQYRKELVSELKNQFSKLDLSVQQKNNLDKLSLDNTVTVTTGHQLNLMTGPLYFIYKIIHAIKLCDSMNQLQNEINFVPVFWMATEDHDFEEINHFYYKNKKIEWNGNYKDFTGEIPVAELKEILSEFYEDLKYYPKGKELREIIEKSYFSEEKLSNAVQCFVHELFKDFGLLMIDGNSSNLKKLFIPYVKDDLKENKSFNLVNQTINHLKSDYKIQVNPRKINFFYRNNKERNRIDETEGKYYILGTSLHFTQENLLLELENHPEKFSPNALMRPVYQEVILPNAAYIGGNAEIAYWLELKNYFDSQNLLYPILIPRNSFFLIDEKQRKKMEKFNWNNQNFFMPKNEIIQSIVSRFSDISFDFDTYENKLNTIFTDLLEESAQTNPVWKNMILAQQKKQLNGLQKINHRFHKAERLKHKEIISGFESLYSEIFPKGTWQERIINFSEQYNIMGKDFLDLIYNKTSEYQSTVNLINI